MGIQDFLEENEKKELLRFTTAGSVDDGKSTLIGRLLHDSKNIYDDHLASIQNRAGSADGSVDWALLTDGLKAEREQGITIDVAYRYFSTPKRKFIIADTPGHEQYTRNMATGASTADLAIILIDARNGVLEQSKRHAFISGLLQIPHMVVAVNKMDLVDYSQDVFESIKEEFSAFAAKLMVHDLRFLPISALLGDNVVNRSENMPWYEGEPLLALLETVHIASDHNFVDFRYPVQHVLRPNLNFRGFCGQVASGIVRKGDQVVALPSGKGSRVKSITTLDGDLDEAFPPLSVTLTLEDEIDISRGDMIAHRHNRPKIGRHFEAMVVWMDEEPLDREKTYLIKQTTRTARVMVDKIHYRVDVNTLAKRDADSLKLNEIGRVIFTAYKPLAYDLYEKNRATGCFIIIDEASNLTVGAAMIIEREPVEKLPASMMRGVNAISERAPQQGVTRNERAERIGQKPVCLWLTGLVSSGKSEIAYQLERQLFERGLAAKVLDGGAMRRAMNRELDFKSEDIAENLRRAAEAAHLLNDAGLIAICSFVSPIASLRGQVREIVGEACFLEIFVDAPVEWCAARDQTGLYEKAKRGEVDNLAGVDLDYERPQAPDLRLQPDRVGIDEAVGQALALLEQRGFLPAPE